MAQNTDQLEDYAVITSGRTNVLSPDLDDDLSREEQQELAGLDEETQSLISPENRIDPEGVPVKRELSRSPIPRTMFVLGFIGIFVLFGFVMMLLAGLGRRSQPQVDARPSTESDLINPSQADLYKGRLALAEQQRDQDNNSPPSSPSPAPSTSPTPKPAQPNRPRAARPLPPRSAATQTVSAARPLPPVTPRPFPRPAPITPISSPQPVITPTTSSVQEPEIDPLEQWNQLASLGSARAEIEDEASLESGESGIQTNRSLSNTAPSNSATSSRFVSEVIGDGRFPSGTPSFQANATTPTRAMLTSATETSHSFPLSPGTRGILEQQEATLQEAAIKQVALGSSAAAEVSVPMFWEAGSNSQANGRFAVTLKEPLIATTGEVALPAGTIFITETSEVSANSRIVNQTVVAVVYQAANGEIRQEPVQPGTILVRGRNNEPLLAQSNQGSNFGNDLVLGLAGALGRTGELLNQGDVFSSASSADGANGSSTSTVINRRSGQTNVLGAALDGFFNPLVRRMEQRAQQQGETSNQTPILVLQQGTTVSVFVNGLLEVAL